VNGPRLDQERFCFLGRDRFGCWRSIPAWSSLICSLISCLRLRAAKKSLDALVFVEIFSIEMSFRRTDIMTDA
jgi:hypothetical protein